MSLSSHDGISALRDRTPVLRFSLDSPLLRVALVSAVALEYTCPDPDTIVLTDETASTLYLSEDTGSPAPPIVYKACLPPGTYKRESLSRGLEMALASASPLYPRLPGPGKGTPTNRYRVHILPDTNRLCLSSQGQANDDTLPNVVLPFTVHTSTVVLRVRSILPDEDGGAYIDVLAATTGDVWTRGAPLLLCRRGATPLPVQVLERTTTTTLRVRFPQERPTTDVWTLCTDMFLRPLASSTTLALSLGFVEQADHPSDQKVPLLSMTSPFAGRTRPVFEALPVSVSTSRAHGCLPGDIVRLSLHDDYTVLVQDVSSENHLTVHLPAAPFLSSLTTTGTLMTLFGMDGLKVLVATVVKCISSRAGAGMAHLLVAVRDATVLELSSDVPTAVRMPMLPFDGCTACLDPETTNDDTTLVRLLLPYDETRFHGGQEARLVHHRVVARHPINSPLARQVLYLRLWLGPVEMQGLIVVRPNNRLAFARCRLLPGGRSCAADTSLLGRHVLQLPIDRVAFVDLCLVDEHGRPVDARWLGGYTLVLHYEEATAVPSC